MKSSHAKKLIKRIDPSYTEMFSGKVYRVGSGAVSVRNHSGKAKNTVIGVHGFLENHCYFTQSYQAPETELILLTCSNYHIPASGPSIKKPDWEVPIKYLEATIEYDAAILNQTLRNLPSTECVRVHGHSRGGAVVLEAVRQEPDLFGNVEVILEAPVLPQARIHPVLTAILEPLGHGMWPWVVKMINSTPSSSYGQTVFGKMNNRKRVLLNKMFTATKNHMTIVRNIENMMAWMEKTDVNVYKHIRFGTFLIPKVDRILDRNAMLTSAEQSPNHIRIIETGANSHFVTLDSSDWVPPLDQMPQLKLASG